jgi:hypothetical protein
VVQGIIKSKQRYLSIISLYYRPEYFFTSGDQRKKIRPNNLQEILSCIKKANALEKGKCIGKMPPKNKLSFVLSTKYLGDNIDLFEYTYFMAANPSRIFSSWP